LIFLPGLDIYYSYLEAKFVHFNLIIFLVDIHSGLNTSDEIDILVDEFMAKYNQKKAIIFNTYQLYRKDKLVHLKEAFEIGRAHV
jgi:proline dehydrogenase